MKNYTENDIRVAAYFNWLNSGCQSGNDLQNWNNALLQLSSNIQSNSCTCTTKTSAKTKTCSCKTSTSSKKSNSKKSK